MEDFYEIGRDSEVKTVKQLLRRFYKYHSERIKGKCRGLKPNVLVLNPPLLVDPSDPFAQDVYYAVYTKGYYVAIEQNTNRPMTGPHPAKLYIQLYPGTNARLGYREHLGTIQIVGNFFNIKIIRKALRLAIQKRKYFCTPARLEQGIEIDPPEGESIMTL